MNRQLPFLFFSFFITTSGCLFDAEQRVSAQVVQTIDADEFEKKLQSTADYQLIDVRTPEEFKNGHLQSAQNMNLFDNDFSAQLEKLDKEKPVFVYCKAGSRSAKAAAQMDKLGFKTIFDLQGGFMAWANAGKPVESGDAKPTSDKFTTSDFERLIQSEQLVLIDFYATWCLPCKKMEPVLDSLSKEFKGQLLITRINVDEAKTLSKELSVIEIPVVSTYKNGNQISTAIGYQSEDELRTIIRRLLQ